MPWQSESADGGRGGVEAKQADAAGRALIAYPDGGQCGVEAKGADAAVRA